MAGLFDTLGTATRGLQVIQRGIATTGHNIANANTPGYSRQRSILQTGLPQPGATGTIGSGVEQVSVERIVDRFVGYRLISETSRQSGLETETSMFREIEAIVNDQNPGGLTGELTGFFNALDDLANAAAPGQPVERGQVLAAAEAFVDTVHRWDSQLRSLQRDADRGITGILPEINAITAQIADLNGQIADAELLSPANDLRDRQDELVLALAEKIQISTLTDDDGMVSIRLADGLSLVDKRAAGELIAVVDPLNSNASDPTFAQVYYRGAGANFDASSQIRGGELGALIEARDGSIAGAIADLDAFTFTLVDRFNEVHRAGLGLVDDGQYNFFADMSGQATVDRSTQNLRIDAAIDPGQGGSLGNISAGLRSAPPPAAIGPAAVGDKGNVELLKNLRTNGVLTYLAGDVPGAATGGTRSIATGLISLAGEIGQRARSSSRALEQQDAVLAAVRDRRDSVSSVSIDEEVAELVKLQANFQANARIVSTVNQLMQDLFDAL